MELPWDKLDVVTWSWQKVLGGEAAHGMLALSPRAVERLESYTPRLAAAEDLPPDLEGQADRGRLQGRTINTPSMLCVEDALDGLRWAERIGGLPALIARSEAQSGRHRRLGRAQRLGCDFLAEDPATRSCTSVCLKIIAPWFTALPADGQAKAAKQLAVAAGKARRGLRHRRLSRRAAGPAHLGRRHGRDRRLEALLPWLDWAGCRRRRRHDARRCLQPIARPRVTQDRMPKVLISDKLSPAAVEIFRKRGIEVDLKPGLSPAELRAIIGDYDGLAIRSATKVTQRTAGRRDRT